MTVYETITVILGILDLLLTALNLLIAFLNLLSQRNSKRK